VADVVDHVAHAEDTDLYWRLQECGTLHNLAEPVGAYRRHGGSISGQSIVNGRIIAVCSQLAALSALRRRRGLADITFSRGSLARYRSMGELGLIYEHAVAQLTADEAGYLRIAAAAKLVELCAYRPYELERSDCRFIRDARRELARLSAANRRQFDRACAAAAARLAGCGLVRHAAALAAAPLYLQIGARLGLNALPRRLRELITGAR